MGLKRMYDNQVILYSASICPCKDCPDRAVGCHGQCKRYSDYRNKLDAHKHTNNKLASEECDVYAYKHINKYKNTRKKKEEI